MTAPELIQEQRPAETMQGSLPLDELDGTLVELFQRAEALYRPDQEFLVRKEEGVWLGEDFATAKSRVMNVAAALLAAGVKKGDRVAIMSRNRPEWAIADLAILHVGAASVPIYNTLDGGKTAYILKDAGAKFLFVENEEIMRLALEARDARVTKRIIVFAPPRGNLPEDVTALHDFESEGAGAPAKTHKKVQDTAASVKEDDLASIVYTSGTTGPPKGVMLSHNNFHSNVIASLRAIPIPTNITCLSFLPLSHVFERVAGYYAMLGVGATIAYAQDITTVRDDIVEVRPHVMASVPRLYEKMYAGVNQKVQAGSWLKRKIFDWAMRVGNEAAEYQVTNRPLPPGLEKRLARADRLVFSKIKERTGGRLLFFISGGAPLARKIEVFFAAMGIQIYQGYGLTETSPVVTCNRPSARRFGSTGRPIDGVEVKIAGDGEILVKGKCVMQGYWKKDKETKEVLKRSWFHTGDVGHLDEDGFLFITDRKKELIVMSNGKNVAPQPIENDLKTQPHIAQAVLIGNDRPYITAIIAPDFEALGMWAKGNGVVAADAADLVHEERIQDLIRGEVEAVNGKLSRYEQVKMFRLLPRELTQEDDELTPTLKVKRRVIDEKYGPIIEEMYAGTNE